MVDYDVVSLYLSVNPVKPNKSKISFGLSQIELGSASKIDSTDWLEMLKSYFVDTTLIKDDTYEKLLKVCTLSFGEPTVKEIISTNLMIGGLKDV
jgi:hypothetical protein